MKQSLLSFLFLSLASSLALNAQITLTGDVYFPAIGDTLRTATDNAPLGVTITAPGGDQTWNFTSLQSGFTTERVIQNPAEGTSSAAFPEANILLEQVEGGEGYYLASDNSFALMGYAGADPLGQGLEVVAPFTPAYVERWGTLNFFDLNDLESALTVAVAADDIPGNIFDGLPVTPDSIRVRVAVSRTDLVDAWGTLSIPGGEYEVLREKRTEYRDVRLDAKVGPFPWTDITDIALEALPIDALGTDTLVTYSFWSDEAKEAVAVIAADPTGTTVESVTYKDNGVVSSTRPVVADSPQLAIYPNPAIVRARLEFKGFPNGTYALSVYNLAGRVVDRREYRFNGDHLATLDVTRYKKGMYLCVLTNTRGERLAARRLMVTTP